MASDRAVVAVDVGGTTMKAGILGPSGLYELRWVPDEDAVHRWLSLAAPVPGFVGFALGRTLWWQPLRDALEGVCGRDEADSRIAQNNRRLIGVYRAAQDGRTIDAGGAGLLT